MPTAASGVLKAKGVDVDPAFEPVVDGDIQNVDASKITSGLLNLARIPSPLTGKELDYDEVLKAIEKHLGVFWFNNHWLPSGKLYTQVSGSGAVSWTDYYVGLATGTTSGSYAAAYKQAYGLSGAYSWAKKRFFGVYVYFNAYAAQYIHIVSGEAPLNASGNTYNHIGFKLIDANLYGTVADGTTEQTLLLETLTAAVYRRLECVFTPGVECRFYVDGVDKGALTLNLPSGTGVANRLFYAVAYNTAASSKILNVYEARTLQVQ
jgi:hypothetical protein